LRTAPKIATIASDGICCRSSRALAERKCGTERRGTARRGTARRGTASSIAVKDGMRVQLTSTGRRQGQHAAAH
jgi:hypothetical protein